jgi:hypothetical protein
MQKKLYITSAKDWNKGPANNYDTANVTDTVVIKEWSEVARDYTYRTTFSWRHNIGMREKTFQCFMFILSKYVLRIHSHILISKSLVSIFNCADIQHLFKRSYKNQMQKKLYITSAKDWNKGPANNYDTANVTGLVSLVHHICKQRQNKKVQDVVSSHCGDKRMERGCTRLYLPDYFLMTS